MVALAAASSPLIDWSALLTVVVLSVVVGVAGVSVYALGVVGVNHSARRTGGYSRPLGVALAILCFGIAIASVAGRSFLDRRQDLEAVGAPRKTRIDRLEAGSSRPNQRSQVYFTDIEDIS